MIIFHRLICVKNFTKTKISRSKDRDKYLLEICVYAYMQVNLGNKI